LDGPVISSVADLSIREDSCGTCHGYECISIPYSGWGYKLLFVANVLGTDILILVSCDGKLGATDFSNARVNSQSDFPTLQSAISFDSVVDLHIV
jgi:hypothetical protein